MNHYKTYISTQYEKYYSCNCISTIFFFFTVIGLHLQKRKTGIGPLVKIQNQCDKKQNVV